MEPVQKLDSLAPGRYGSNLKSAICIRIAVRWMPQNLTYDK